MSDKQKKFKPDPGFVAAVHANVLGIRTVADKLNVFAEDLAKAMSEAGFQLIPDPFNLSSDAGKVIEFYERQKTQGLQVVKETTDDDSGSDTSAD